MSKKFGVVDTYYSILTKGPVSGVPAYFIELSDFKAKKMSMKKLGKLINKECASHCLHISGSGVYNEEILNWSIAEYMKIVVEINSSDIAPDNFNWSLLQHPHVFVYVNVETENIEKGLEEAATAYFYMIGETEALEPDGLPKTKYRPDNLKGILLTPANSKAYERVVQICKHYGYYLNIEYNHMIGIR